MPHQKAAFKALRKSRVLHARHAAVKKRIRDLRKKAIKLSSQKKFDEALKMARDLQKAVDKASRARGFLKKNTAARIKSRLAASLQRAKQAPAK